MREEDSNSQRIVDEAAAELVEIVKELRETKRVLARDWAAMTPRDRSHWSRVADELKSKQQTLEQTIELNSFR